MSRASPEDILPVYVAPLCDIYVAPLCDIYVAALCDDDRLRKHLEEHPGNPNRPNVKIAL